MSISIYFRFSPVIKPLVRVTVKKGDFLVEDKIDVNRDRMN